MQHQSPLPAWQQALGGMFGLIIGMGVGRFAYTPLLPMMQQEYGFGSTLGGGLATMNYGGYLLGALVCMRVADRTQRVWLVRGSLVLSVATTAAMGLLDTPAFWWVLRFLAGLASAGVMVLGSAIALDSLAQHRSGHWRGLVFSGVGAGMVLSGVVVLTLDHLLNARHLWLTLGLLSVPLAAASWFWLRSTSPGSPPQVAAPAARAPADLPPFLFWLTAAYFAVGLGYIVSGTFLVAIVQANQTSSTAALSTWVVVGLAAAGSTLVWPWLAARFGTIQALVAAYALQALGIVLPALSPGLVAALSGALLFGGTFMGIVALTMSLGQHLAPHQSTRALGALTAAYGLGQMIGPLLAGVLADQTASFTVPLLGAAAVVAAGGVLLVIGVAYARRYAPHRIV